MDPDRLIEDLNELLRRDEDAVERLTGARFAVGQLGGIRGLTHYAQTAGSPSTVCPLDLLNMVLSQDALMVLAIRTYPENELAAFQIARRDPWLTDPRSPHEILQELPHDDAVKYVHMPPVVGNRVMLSVQHADAIRNCFPAAFLEMCDQQTRVGVMLHREGDTVFVQFGDSAAAVPLHITLLHTHAEDFEKNHGKPEETDQEGTRGEGGQVQQGSVVEAAAAEGNRQGQTDHA